MGNPLRKRLLPRPGAKAAVAGLVAGMLGQEAMNRSWSALIALADGTKEHDFKDGSAFFRLVLDLQRYVMPGYTAILGVAMIAVPLIIVARMLARGRVRAGSPDPLDRARAFVSTHKGFALLPAVAGTAMLMVYRAFDSFDFASAVPQLIAFTPGFIAAFVGFYALSRACIRAVTAPTVDVEEDASRGSMTIGDDEITFSAVAVTPETKAAVVAVALVPQIVTVLVSTLKVASELGWLVLAYIVAVAGAVAAFSRASRVAVGIDGVLVRGTSRQRFFAYRDVDRAELRGSDLCLLRGDKVVLRLQLHGADASRAEAVLARIQGHIARVAERRGKAEEGLVESATAEQIARAVSGAVDFRQPTVSREALWEIVEGPTVDGAAREAAAKALVKTAVAEDRARLRVAASRCADPRVRVALERIDEGHDAEEVADEAPVGRRAALGR
jgi:hypothetical protein